MEFIGGRYPWLAARFTATRRTISREYRTRAHAAEPLLSESYTRACVLRPALGIVDRSRQGVRLPMG